MVMHYVYYTRQQAHSGGNGRNLADVLHGYIITDSHPSASAAEGINVFKYTNPANAFLTFAEAKVGSAPVKPLNLIPQFPNSFTFVLHCRRNMHRHCV